MGHALVQRTDGSWASVRVVEAPIRHGVECPDSARHRAKGWAALVRTPTDKPERDRVPTQDADMGSVPWSGGESGGARRWCHRVGSRCFS
jgi:hypothetical protein